MTERLKQRIDALGVWGALALGVLFALAFCPTSAALFFGNIMASLSTGSSVTMPLLYGVGTALPVIVFAVLIALGSQALGKAFGAVSRFERWARTDHGNRNPACRPLAYLSSSDAVIDLRRSPIPAYHDRQVRRLGQPYRMTVP